MKTARYRKVFLTSRNNYILLYLQKSAKTAIGKRGRNESTL